jgi:hypothetical protein
MQHDAVRLQFQLYVYIMYSYELIKPSSRYSTFDIQANTPINIYQNTPRHDPQHRYYLESPLRKSRVSEIYWNWFQ